MNHQIINNSIFIFYKSKKIEIILKIKSNSTYKIFVKNNKIYLISPVNLSNQNILNIIEKNFNLIEVQLKKSEVINYIDIEKKYYYLFGKKIEYNIQKNNSKYLLFSNGHFLKFSLKNDDNLKNKIEQMLKKELLTYLKKRVNEYQKIMNISISYDVFLRKKSWAWATNHITKRKIYFSNNLLLFSKQIIDYVIIHELCHHFFSNHSNDFWLLVSKYYPNYKEAKIKLKNKELL
ncbi:YgjP-like metallopeptidase domain-containing protein [[Mycoplasma] collis]|uniref:YgjP-like metallopeptidase domain-containing protein n=1 Tax=[Mycoplasma] collis TaxID=2127 RepID=UPI00068DB242|nr:YgjP-like metallopeptidase domain-containing protein [[Mycoplasma] collis]